MWRSRVLGCKVFVPALFGMLLGTPAWAQTGPAFQCVANAGVPPVVRAEGLAELTGDVVIQCNTNGPLPPAGSPPPLVTVEVFLNTSVTSRVFENRLSEALLILNDPLPENQYIAEGGESPNTVGCRASPTCPNVFHGRQSGPTHLIWDGIPFDPPKNEFTQVFRLTNIRADATHLSAAFPDPDAPIQITRTVRITPGGRDVTFSPIEFNDVLSTAPAVKLAVQDSASILGSVGHTGKLATLAFHENFANAIKKENCAVRFSDPNPSPSDFLAICRTNLLWPFVSEHADFEAGYQLPNTTSDPFGVSDRVGVARGGQRLIANFNNIPSGLRIFLPITNLNAGPGHFARLRVSPDSSVPATDQGNSFAPMEGICPDYQTTGHCAAAWEVLDSNPEIVETFLFTIDGVWPKDTPFTQTTVTTVTPSLGPSAAAWDRAGLIATPGFQGYVIAVANFQYAHGFGFISDTSAQRLAAGYLALILPDRGARPEAENDIGAWEAAAEANGQLRAIGSSRLVLLGEDKQQTEPRRFELTSEGYLPKRLRLGSAGNARLTDFTISVQTGSASSPSAGPSQSVGDSWLRVEKIGDQTPVTLVLTVHPEGLEPGTYEGSVTAAPAVPPGVTPVVVPVELVVPPPGPRVRTFGVTSAGSYAHSIVAPGEAVVIFGQGFGPTDLAGLALENGAVTTEIGETRILFDGEAAPMIYSVANQASCFVPFSVEGKKFVEMVVEYQGVSSPPVRLAVLPVKPALLTSDQSGGGIGAILNQDNSYNLQKPAQPGEIVQIFGIGGGQTTPPSVGGRLQTGEATYNLPMQAFLDGVEVETIYAGPAPGLVEGVFQINLRLPEDLLSGQVPITIYFGDTLHTQPGVTVWVGER
jgi:uncharacterized protein (TIGR03437 family)